MRKGESIAVRLGPAAGALVVLLLVLGPSTSGSTIAGSTVKAPFHGVAQTTTSKVITGCARAHVGTSAFFVLSTGYGGFSGSSSARFCTSGTSGQHSLNMGLSAGVMRVSVRLPSFYGNHLVVARLTLSANGSDVVQLGNCAPPIASVAIECNETAYWDAGVNGGEVVQSAGNSNWYSSNVGGGLSNWTGLDEICKSTGCTQNGSIGSMSNPGRTLNVSVFVNVTNAYATQVYYFDLFLYAHAGVQCSSSLGTVKGCTASAKVVFSGPGYGVTLKSVRVY